MTRARPRCLAGTVDVSTFRGRVDSGLAKEDDDDVIGISTHPQQQQQMRGGYHTATAAA